MFCSLCQVGMLGPSEIARIFGKNEDMYECGISCNFYVFYFFHDVYTDIRTLTCLIFLSFSFAFVRGGRKMASGGSSVTQWRLMTMLRDYITRTSPSLGTIQKELPEIVRNPLQAFSSSQEVKSEGESDIKKIPVMTKPSGKCFDEIYIGFFISCSCSCLLLSWKNESTYCADPYCIVLTDFMM